MSDINGWIDKLAVANDTKVLLRELVVRKEKEQLFKKRLLYVSIVNGAITVIIVFWLLKLDAFSRGNMWNVIDYFSASKASVLFILLAISSFIYSSSLSKQHKKHKDKYDTLREETTRKIAASWKVNEDSRLKDEISEKLKAEKDINIRFGK